MKALTLWEPWATFMALGYKTIETRDWPTRYRGALAIHAAKRRPDPDDVAYLWEAADIREPIPQEWPLGRVLCLVDLTDCVFGDQPGMLMPEGWKGEHPWREYVLGALTTDRFGFVTCNLRRLEKPILVRGAQGLWSVPDDVRREVRSQVGG